MKKVLLASGAGVVRLLLILAIVGISCFLAPSSYAQGSYSLFFSGIPAGGSISLNDYIGLDRKLKPNVPSQKLRIGAPTTLIGTKKVYLAIKVSADGTTIGACNGIIATAITKPFDISSAGRELGASDFTGSSGIGIQTSTDNQQCIDGLTDKITEGVASIPVGIYKIEATLHDDATTDMLASGFHEITIESASSVEAILNLTSPANGERALLSPTVIFNFDNSIPGRLLAFEHSNMSQSPDDATRDLNSSLKILDVQVNQRGTNQIVATFPGVALRPWTANTKVSWLFLGQMPGSSDMRRSAIWSFTIVPSDPLINSILTALSSAPDPIGSTYNNLLNAGYVFTFSASDPIYIQDGEGGTLRAVDMSEVLSLLNSLQTRNTRLTAAPVSR
jgi:hypothetical protein